MRLFTTTSPSRLAVCASKEKPVSQDERIIEYKKKEFEISTAEDVDFEEIKDSTDKE